MSQEELKEKGNNCFKAGKFQEAVDCYTAALDVQPESHILLSNRSVAYSKLGKFSEALADALKCLEFSPSFSRGHLRKTVALNGLGRWEEAMQAAEEGYKLRGSDKICKDCISQWLLAATEFHKENVEEMSKLGIDLPTGTAPISAHYLAVISDLSFQYADTCGVSSDFVKKYLFELISELDHMLQQFGHSSSLCGHAWADAVSQASVTDPRTHKLPQKIAELIPTATAKFASWLDKEVDPALYPVIRPILLLAVILIYTHMVTLRCVNIDPQPIQILAKASLPFFKSILSSSDCIGPNLKILGELIASFTLESAFDQEDKDAKKAEMQIYVKQMEHLLPMYPSSTTEYDRVKKSADEILAIAHEILQRSDQSSTAEISPSQTTEEMMSFIAQQQQLLKEKGVTLCFRDIDNLVLSTGPLLHLDELDKATEVLQQSEQFYFHIITTQMKDGLWSVDDTPRLLFHPMVMIFANALLLVGKRDALVADAVIRWKCLPSELRALLIRQGVGESFLNTFQSINSAKMSSPTETDRFVALASKHNQEANRVLQQSGPEIVTMLSKQSCQQIQQHLEPDQVVLEYCMAPLYDTKAHPVPIPPKCIKLSGILVVIQPEGEMMVKVVDFEKLKSLSQNMHNLLMREVSLKQTGKPWKHLVEKGNKVAQEVLQVLLPEDVQSVLTSSRVKRIFFCPDQFISKLPLDLLQFSNKETLGSKCAIAYLSSAKELVRESTVIQMRSTAAHASPGDPKSTECFIFANPNFDLEQQSSKSNVGLWGSLVSLLPSFFSLPSDTKKVEPLPKSEEEAHEVDSILSTAQGGTLTTHLRTGDQATLSTVLHVDSPLLIHLSTHGFSQPQFDYRYSSLWTDTRSGLLLAGANTYLVGRFDRIVEEAGTGELSALAASGMRLENTCLVYLSTCRSSYGYIGLGESISSLGQSFRCAGAQTVIATLWPISDDIGRKFAFHFYTALCRTGTHPSEAIKYAKEKLQEQEHWYEWASFMCIGCDTALFQSIDPK